MIKNKYVLIGFIFLSMVFTASGMTKSPLDKVIAKNPLSRTAVVAVSVRDVKTGKPVYEKNADLLLHPASTLKAFTTPVLIKYLGKNYRVTTGLYKYKEDYYLKLSGDPLLTSVDLAKLFSDIEINTPLIIDDSKIDDIPWGIGWMWDDEDNPNMPKISAYNINHNLISVKSTYKGLLKPVENPRQNFLNHLNKPVKTGLTPDEAVLISEISHSLMEEIKIINQNSDNLAAETLLKHIGGTTKAGLTALDEFYTTIGAPPSEQLIVDASGVSHNDLVQTDWMSLALSKLYHTPDFETYKNTLAQPGLEGTLENRLSELSGNLWAKTGTLAGISGITGYLNTKSGKLYCFAILVQNFKGSAKPAKELEDEILKEIFTRPLP